MPMASLRASLAACNAPNPVMPAAAKITSTPRSNWLRASSAPRAGSTKAAGVVPVTLSMIAIPGTA
jgi:hypothetical protein